MKSFFNITLLVLIFFLNACAGSDVSVTPVNKKVSQGMKQIIKGTENYHRGCYDNAMAYFLRAHELFATIDHLKGIAMSMNNMGSIYMKIGDYETAILFFDEAHQIYSDIKHDADAAKALSNMAVALMKTGKFDEAEKSLDRAENISDVFASGPSILKHRATLHINRNDFQKAEDLLITALSKTGTNDFSSVGSINFALGDLMKRTERYDEAIKHFTAALDADREAAISSAIAEDLSAIGEIYSLQEQYDKAVDYLKRSLKIFLLTENPEKIDAVKNALNMAAENADVDMRVIQHFIAQWEEGVMLEPPCK